MYLIDTARFVCEVGSMKRYGVRPSVCPIRPLQQRAAGLLLYLFCAASAASARSRSTARSSRRGSVRCTANGPITIAIRARFELDSATTRYEMRTIRVRFEHATTSYEELCAFEQ